MLKTSVLILHYNKNYEIELVLEAFLNQTVAKSTFEIVIADDGSEHSIKNIVDRYIENGLQINLLELKHTGNRALNRNLAISEAKGDYIIFFDSDMVPCLNFIERHVHNLSESENIVSSGYRFLLNDFPHELITTQTIKEKFYVLESLPCEQDERLQMIYAHNKNGLNLNDAWYMLYSHNIALSKSLYNKVQGFDENFRNGWGAEDVEFGLQLFKAGAKFIYDKKIIAYHIYHDAGSGKIEQYKKNLKYFYTKYKSFEPELFMLEYRMDPMSFYKLYGQILNKNHLSLINESIIQKETDCLFIGFTDTSSKIKENGNILISTSDKNAKYNLVGNCLPYPEYHSYYQFQKSIISNNYSIFSDDYLYLIMKEAKRCTGSVFILNEELIPLNDYWKSRTGYTFDEFENIEKVRVVLTPDSTNRFDNILYSELARALNENNFYASLEFTFDGLKDQEYIFPFNSKNNTILQNYHKRNLTLLKSGIPCFVDKLLAGNDQGDTEKLYWWGDLENEDLKESERNLISSGYKKIFYRNTKESVLKPGIRNDEINKFLVQNKNHKDGIIITDLFIEDITRLEGIIKQFSAISKAYPKLSLSIVTLNTYIEEFQIMKNTKYFFTKTSCSEEKHMLWEMQNKYFSRMEKLIALIADKDNVHLIQTNGSLEEVDDVIKENRFYLDLNSKKTFNPFVLQAAAYGLYVITSSNIYETYGYSNIKVINRHNNNSIVDLEEILPLLIQNSDKLPEIETLLSLNNKNSWSNMLQNMRKLC